ncbi:MAG: hypothetical protein ND807_07195 [Vicinamibacterales bacterium]|nr:hypothetical protein [Vicinamibacterales bacterium]
MQTNNFCYRTLGLAALVTLLQSCGGPKSSSTSGPNGGPVPTSRITMNLTVESSESGITVVRANLNDGQLLGESYRLDGGDFLRACANGACRNMADNDSVFTPDYIARFDYQPGVDHVVSFNRQQGGNAPDSRVALPPAFTLVTPANHQQVTNGETVVVSWSPTGAPARVALSYHADCTFPSGPHGFSFGTLSTDVNADGQESVAIDPMVTFDRTTSPFPPTRCSIDVTVSHELQGRIDPAFHNGIARGIVSRKVNLDYIPR